MSRKKIVFGILILLSIVVIPDLTAQEIGYTTVKEKIDAINKIIDEASIKQDYETIAFYYEEEVITLPNNEPMIRGKKAFIENEKKAAKAGIKILSIKSNIIDLFGGGGFYHEVGTYELSLQIPGVPFPITDKGKYLVIWQEQKDGTLKIKLETWNNDEERK